MPWLLDGNNLARGGDREAVRRAALAVARRERVRIVVFFDGAPPAGAGARERLGAVEVHYAASADAAILAFLERGARGWRLATDDRELQRRARAAGAEVVGAAAFWRKAAGPERPGTSGAPAPSDLAGELEYFEDSGRRLPDSPVRVARRRARLRPRKALE